MSDLSKKKNSPLFTGSLPFGDIVVREFSPDASRIKVKATLTADASAGTVLEETEGSWSIATAGTGRLGILTHDAFGSSEKQEVGLVVCDAVACAKNLIIETGLLAQASETFSAQRVKLI